MVSFMTFSYTKTGMKLDIGPESIARMLLTNIHILLAVLLLGNKSILCNY